jgi:LmbE family N-acetylglucosaminyl deacetylase
MKILAVGAHPDDIEFGCGGTLMKYVNAGHDVYLLVLTDGSIGADPALRMAEQKKSADVMGIKALFWGGFPDTELQDNRELIIKIEEIEAKVMPDIVFLNHPDDVHQDHRALANAGISATRYVKEVLFYEVPTTVNFEPEIFVNIQDVLQKKLDLLRMHASQVNRTRVPNLTILESAQSCATFRGYQGRVKYAEGFKGFRSVREITK